MHIHAFLHVPFEGLGSIEQWITQHGHTVDYTRWYEVNQTNQTDGIGKAIIQQADMLIVMGGPMSVHDGDTYCWLTTEMECLAGFIQTGKPVLGICLGAQMIATALGAQVLPGTKEIGWYPIFPWGAGAKQKPITQEHTQLANAPIPAVFADFPEQLPVFHWHGETFTLPADAIPLWYSEACPLQGFLYRQNVVALQFHFEMTEQSIAQMYSHSVEELRKNTGASYVQATRETQLEQKYIEKNTQHLFAILDYLTNPNV
jgi:GMP synthase-like glutamine amidotransferase